MKKTISILFILFCCLVSGCGKENLKERDTNTSSEQASTANGEYEISASEQSNVAEEEDNIDSSEQSMEANRAEEIDGAEQSIAENRTGEFVRNPYFYDKEEFFLQATAKYFVGHFGGVVIEQVEQIVYIQVDMLQTYEEGSVYKFTVDMDERGFYYEGWLDQCFYVTKDRIYVVTSAAYLPDIVFDFEGDDDIVTEIYDTDEKMIGWGTIVCQEDEMTEEQESVYRSITKDGSQVTYYAYMIKANGDIGWSLYYTWQEGNGLVSCGFRHGPGEGYDLILDEIEEIIVVG